MLNQRAVSIRVTSETNSTNAVWQVIYHLTFCVLCTKARAWILAFVSNARTIRWTIAIQRTFRSTALVWISEIFRQTLARAGAVLFTANRIRATRTRNAWIELRLWGDFFHRTLDKRITDIVSVTFTDRRVANDVTLSIQTTNSIGTRISAMSMNASQMIGALRVRHTFWSTIRWTANEIGQTITSITISVCTAFCILSARRTQAWIHIFILNGRRLFDFWLQKRISLQIKSIRCYFHCWKRKFSIFRSYIQKWEMGKTFYFHHIFRNQNSSKQVKANMEQF